LLGAINTYGYANANPVLYADSTGEFALLIPAVWFGGEALASWILPVAAGTAVAAIMVTPGDSKALNPAAQKAKDYAGYKNICNQPTQPGLDKCEEAKWKKNKAQ
jgi:hypothetical protein